MIISECPERIKFLCYITDKKASATYPYRHIWWGTFKSGDSISNPNIHIIYGIIIKKYNVLEKPMEYLALTVLI